MNRKETVLGFISDENYKPMKVNEIAMMLCVSKEDKNEFKAIICELENEGKIRQIPLVSRVFHPRRDGCPLTVPAFGFTLVSNRFFF